MHRLASLFVLSAFVALVGCTTLRGTAGGSGGNAKSCKSCERMCEVAGDAQENPASVAKCKADCSKKCG